MRAARAARLFFLSRPIKILICGVVVVVAVVDAKAPYSQGKVSKCCEDLIPIVLQISIITKDKKNSASEYLCANRLRVEMV